MNKQQLNLLIKQLTELCAKKLSNGSTPPKKETPSTSDGKNYTQYCHKCGSLQVTRSNAPTQYILAARKYETWEIDDELADILFLSSLLPHVRDIPVDHKLDWQIKCLKLFKRYIRD